MPQIKIALAGNPNSGKTSLFNLLTGLNQRVGNYPGVTVDKKTGVFHLKNQEKAKLIDLPGIYGLYPKSEDEFVAHTILTQPHNPLHPDLVVVIADATSLKRNLLLCSQIIDLHIPVVLALTMMDIAQNRGLQIDIAHLSQELGVPVVSINPRNNIGTENLIEVISKQISEVAQWQPNNFVALEFLAPEWKQKITENIGAKSQYAALQIICNDNIFATLNDATKQSIEVLKSHANFNKTDFQTQDILSRYSKIDGIIERVVNYLKQQTLQTSDFTRKADKWLMHPVIGYVLLFAILFLVFQSIFSFAAYPMDWIDASFSQLQNWVASLLPDTAWANLLTEGILAGIGGIVIFVPQIAILFFFITILEDSGYMARISVLSDKLMQSVGMNGRSIVPLMSGMACAIPSIMAARTISNAKERLLTILVLPLMSCSARLPVYAIIIALVVPQKSVLGVFNLQGLVMMGMYVLGFVMAMLVSLVLRMFIRIKGSSYFIMELPAYRMPRWKNAFITMYEKAKIFVVDAGKIIIMISIALWFLAAYGPSKHREKIEEKYTAMAAMQDGTLSMEQEEQKANEKLATSYIGIVGKSIEPVFAPLGYDWKIVIALLSSFAAREVFLGTIATLYNVSDADENVYTLKQKMRQAQRADGTLVYTLATGVSLLMFYAFAMQCMSTVAIVHRETKSIKWTAFQIVYMSVLAYVAAFIAFNVFK